MQKYDVAIVGGGAAGLACAVTLKELDKNLRVIILEAGDRAGRKIAATGNGQGNVSNDEMTPEHFHGSGASYAAKLCCNGLYDHLKLFDCLFTKDKLGRIYPSGKQASALSDCLIRRAEKAGVVFSFSSLVTAIKKGFTLTVKGGTDVRADYVVLCAGGKAQRQFNTDGNGFALAQSAGHKITELYPSLVQLRCETRDIKTLKGIRAECRVSAYSSSGELLGSTTGDVIFTDYGVSGNAIFYISSCCAAKDGVTLSLEFLPGISEKEIEENVSAKIAAGYPSSELLSGTLHNQLGRAVIRRLKEVTASSVAAEVKNFTLRVEGSLGFDYAQVTKGGVSFDKISGSLESKIVPNLYFAGEILDVDGDCGGYNLTWAFISGMHAGKSIVNAINSYD